MVTGAGAAVIIVVDVVILLVGHSLLVVPPVGTVAVGWDNWVVAESGTVDKAEAVS